MSEFSSLATKTSDMQLAPTTSAWSGVKPYFKKCPAFFDSIAMKAKRICLWCILLSLTLTLNGCAGKKTRTVYAMDTVMHLTAYGAAANKTLDAAAEEIYRLESLLSHTRETSVVSTLNRTGSAEDATLRQLLHIAMRVYQESGGAFDPTVAPLVELWGFTTDQYRVPAQSEIDALLPLVGADTIEFPTDERVELPEGVAVDLGAVAKGYAADCVRAIFAENDVSGVIELGGNVCLSGTKNNGEPWRVAIRDPKRNDRFLGYLSLTGGCIVTSGSYERYFEEDGVRYHHIIDPQTGYPAKSSVESVTIVCESGAYADALSTAAFVLDVEGSFTLWRNMQEGEDTIPFGMVLLTTEGDLYYTENLSESFDYSMMENDYVYHEIRLDET